MEYYAGLDVSLKEISICVERQRDTRMYPRSKATQNNLDV